MSFDILGHRLKLDDYCITGAGGLRIGRVTKLAGASMHLHVSHLDGPDTASYSPNNTKHCIFDLNPFLNEKMPTQGNPTDPTGQVDYFGKTIRIGDIVVHRCSLGFRRAITEPWRSYYFLAMSEILAVGKNFLWARQISEQPDVSMIYGFESKAKQRRKPMSRKVKSCIILSKSLPDSLMQLRLKSI